MVIVYTLQEMLGILTELGFWIFIGFLLTIAFFIGALWGWENRISE